MNLDEMSWDEIDELLETTPNGKSRMELCRKAWEKADQYQYYTGQINYRLEYIHDSVFYDDLLELYVIFPAVLKLHDQHLKEYGYDELTYDVLWDYKWILGNASDFYQISLEQFERFSEDFKKRCIQNGYSLRTYYQKRNSFYKHVDEKKATEYYQKFLDCPRDSLSDCAACELSTQISYCLDTDDLEQALHLFVPLKERRLTCGEQPEATFGHFLSYYNDKMQEGNMDYKETAGKICENLRRSISRKGTAPFCVSNVLMYYAIAEPGKALGYYKKNWNYFEENRNPMERYNFAISAIRFLNNLKDKETYKMRMDTSFPFYNEENVYNVAELTAYYRKCATDIAEKLDARNQNHSLMEYMEKMTRV